MNGDLPIADLHCHPSLKPHRNKDQYPNIWTQGRNKTPRDYFKKVSARKLAIKEAISGMADYSQSNLDDCFLGNNRLVFCSVYPFERAFLKPNRPFNKGSFLQKFILRKIVFRKRVSKKSREIDAKVGSLLSGASLSFLRPIINRIHDSSEIYADYYSEYISERDYLFNNNNSQSEIKHGEIQPIFKIVKNYNELKTSIIDKNTICGIYTVEGMHAYVKYRKEDIFTKNSITEIPQSEQTRLFNDFKAHINLDRTEGKAPFFITFAHHFNNLIVGHSESFLDATSNLKPGFNLVFDQGPGKNDGLPQIGKQLIKDCLLSREFGPRILIDTKHMSIRSRKDYYDMIRGNNTIGNSMRLQQVPIICSHTAVSGIDSYETAERERDSQSNEENSFVSRYDINITDADIIEIFNSDGLIGICMHDGRMPGGKFRKLLKKYKKNIEVLKKMHVQMFLTNVFHVVKVLELHIRNINKDNPSLNIDEKDAWKIISLGSDNDGIVDPFDGYNKASTLKNFKADIIHYLNNYEISIYQSFKIVSLHTDQNQEAPMENEMIKRLMMGQTGDKIADRIFYNNTDVFLSRYFSNEYLNTDDNLFV